jgi:hypothetical protein
MIVFGQVVLPKTLQSIFIYIINEKFDARFI